MDIEQIKLLVAQGESTTIEFKTSVAGLESAFNTLCAFLNTNGGTILIGVKDNGVLCGQEITDSIKQDIANKIKRIEPPVAINLHYEPYQNNKSIIVIEGSCGEHTPYVYNGRPYYRVQSTTDVMPQHLYEQLIVRRDSLHVRGIELLVMNIYLMT